MIIATYSLNSHRWNTPFTFRYLGVHANEIVGVHHGVNKFIRHDGNINITIVVPIKIEPIEKENRVMMLNAEE